MFGLGAPELLIILGIVVILFGAKHLPQLGSGVGKGIRNFKKGLNSDDEENKNIETPENNDQESPCGIRPLSTAHCPNCRAW